MKEMLESGKAGDARGRQAYRPLPVVPVVHDHLPVGRALHASRRSWPRLYRGDIPAALARPPACVRFSPGCCLIRRASAPRSSQPTAAKPFKARGRRRCRTSASVSRAMLDLAPARLPPRSPFAHPGVFAPEGARRGRVALLSGCAQPLLQPGFNDAAIRLLNRHGVEVVLPQGEGCCGALVHHMGRDAESHAFAKAQHRRLDRRDGRRRPRRHRHHGVRLRHHDQGLRLHAARRPGLCRQGAARVGDHQGRHRVPRCA